MQPGHAEQRTHDYVRHGAITLFAGLGIATAARSQAARALIDGWNRRKHPFIWTKTPTRS
jgi:hypothetical protein